MALQAYAVPRWDKRLQDRCGRGLRHCLPDARPHAGSLLLHLGQPSCQRVWVSQPVGRRRLVLHLTCYQDFQFAQIEELLTQYGPIGEVWIDIPNLLG